MQESNVFSLPSKLNKDSISSKKNKKKNPIVDFEKVESLFTERSAQEFANSILLGNLYEELRPKNKKTQSNLTKI